MSVPDSGARRRQVLTDLLSRSISVERAADLLKREPWDSDVALVTVTTDHVGAELQRFLANEVSAQAVEDWADLFEVREDVDFENDTVKAIVFELANPVLEGALTGNSAKAMLDRLAR